MAVKTGIKDLDVMLRGGFPENAVVLLSGGPGSGKTLLSLKYILEGARKGEKCCFLTLNEEKGDILRACESVKSLSELKKYEGKNVAIEHIQMSQSNVSMKRFVEIISSYPKIDRLVIDNVNKLLLFSESKKSFRAYLVELISNLRTIGSSMLICETESDDKLDSSGHESFECDGVVQLSFLDIEEKPKRVLVVHKMRYTSFDPKVAHELVIDGNDIRLAKTKMV